MQADRYVQKYIYRSTLLQLHISLLNVDTCNVLYDWKFWRPLQYEFLFVVAAAATRILVQTNNVAGTAMYKETVVQTSGPSWKRTCPMRHLVEIQGLCHRS